MSLSLASNHEVPAEEHLYKIVFSGPVGVGKSTAISVLSDIEPFSTEEFATDETQNRKEKTTVAMDYGLMFLDGNKQERIHLYGTPGQKRFDFMWEVLLDGGIGLVLLLDNSSPDPFAEMFMFLDGFKEFIAKKKIVIGVNFMEKNPDITLDMYHEKLNEIGMNVPVFEVDSRSYDDVSLLVQALLYSVDPWVGV